MFLNERKRLKLRSVTVVGVAAVVIYEEKHLLLLLQQMMQKNWTVFSKFRNFLALKGFLKKDFLMSLKFFGGKSGKTGEKETGKEKLKVRLKMF